MRNTSRRVTTMTRCRMTFGWRSSRVAKPCHTLLSSAADGQMQPRLPTTCSSSQSCRKVGWWPSPGPVLVSGCQFYMSTDECIPCPVGNTAHWDPASHVPTRILRAGLQPWPSHCQCPKVQSCSLREVSGRTISASQPLSLMENWSKVAGTNADCWRPATAAHAWELQLRGSRAPSLSLEQILLAIYYSVESCRSLHSLSPGTFCSRWLTQALAS